MIKNKQLIVDSIRGDCFRACLTSILGIPNGNYLPTANDKDWYLRYAKFLTRFGMALRYELKACWQQGYWIATVPSLNYKDCTHAIIMKDFNVFHDPTTSKNKYESGRCLLCETTTVLGGYIFTVEDMSKIHKLKIYRDKKIEKRTQKYKKGL